MKVLRLITFIVFFISLSVYNSFGQTADSIWPLNRCIEYALVQNISIQQSGLNKEKNMVNLEQSKASRFPSLSGSASGNISWGKEYNGQTQEFGDFSSSRNIGFGINTNVTLYNGFKTENSIKQSQISYEVSLFDTETIKESVCLNVLDAYLQVLYAQEQVKNSEEQIESTKGQLILAEERLNLGAISKSDYLLVKSELASEQLSLTNAQNLLVSSTLNLKQLMELPINSNFYVEQPLFDKIILHEYELNADSVYKLALEIKPRIKSSELSIRNAEIGIDIARAAYQPKLMLSCGVSTGYAFGSNLTFDYQLQNKINPNLGLSLSVPIYQKRQAKSGVSIAKINTDNTQLEAANARNQLRKEIEQACSDVLAADKKYNASLEQFKAVEEAYQVASEKYKQGMLNSVDFIVQKTKLINAESELLQSKYNLVFSYKILDFYKGKTLNF
ncbi:MAG: TolC family protein [Bacteroidales bacterium]|nr:TolC family protein [Bacteroidales bacterium]